MSSPPVSAPTPLTDALKINSEALLLIGQKGVPERIVEAILTLGDHARRLERVLRMQNEALAFVLAWRNGPEGPEVLFQHGIQMLKSVQAALRAFEELHDNR